MHIEQLCIRHLSKRTTALGGRAEDYPGTFFFDSCQRQMWIGLQQNDRARLATPDIEIYHGERAYLFLLRVAAGLESAIVGETDVFGQLKQAWRDFERTAHGALKRELGVWLQKIFEDTKEIRSRHLENLGGASYGTLARRLLALESHDRVFIVGAGKIARSVAPFLLQSPLLLWNRTPGTALVLASELRAQGAVNVAVIRDEADGWRGASHAVVCIPLDADSGGDIRRIALWSAKPAQEKRLVLHMGCLRGQGSKPWEALPGFRCLDNLFELRSAQAEVRDSQLSLARRMCIERSQQRTLGGSLTMAHGWEDLGAFV